MASGGKGSRARTKARRKQERKNKKESMQKMYQLWASQGTNSKRQRAKTFRRTTVKVHKHPINPCGNLACMKCYSYNFNAWLDKDGTPHMPPKVYEAYQELLKVA